MVRMNQSLLLPPSICCLLSFSLLLRTSALLSICYSFSLSFHSTGLTIPLLMECIQKLTRNDYKQYWILLKKTNTAYMYLVHTFTLKNIFSNSNSCYFLGTQWKLHHVPCQLRQWLWKNSPKRTGEAIFAIPVMYTACHANWRKNKAWQKVRLEWDSNPGLVSQQGA